MRYFTIDGKRKSITQWAAEAGISRQAMAARVDKAESPEELALVLTAEDFQGKSAKKQLAAPEEPEKQ